MSKKKSNSAPTQMAVSGAPDAAEPVQGIVVSGQATLIGFLREMHARGKGPVAAHELVSNWNRYSKHPVPQAEVDGLVGQVYGALTRTAERTHTLRNLRVLRTDPPFYTVELVGYGDLECTAVQWNSYKLFSDHVSNKLHLILPTVTTDVWKTERRRLLDTDCTFIDPPPNSSEEDAAFEKIQDYFLEHYRKGVDAVNELRRVPIFSTENAHQRYDELMPTTWLHFLSVLPEALRPTHLAFRLEAVAERVPYMKRDKLTTLLRHRGCTWHEGKLPAPSRKSATMWAYPLELLDLGERKPTSELLERMHSLTNLFRNPVGRPPLKPVAAPTFDAVDETIAAEKTKKRIM